MTNGEMIKAIFPSAEIDIGNGGNDIWIAIDCWTIFKKEWWNAEYKEPTTKNNLGVDCVARQDVERYIEGFINEYTPKEELEFINLELDGLKHLPPAIPIRPKGYWIPTYGNVKCSVCGSVKDNREVGKATHYCDFCGAKMESEKE